MKVSLLQRIGLSSLAVTLAAFAHQPAMQAEVRSPLTTTLTSQIANQINQRSTTLIAQAKALKAGTFVADDHPTSGGARIVEGVDGQHYLELDASFRSDAGPDLVVLLHNEAVPQSYNSSNYVNLGQIQRTVGAQRYAIPAGVDLASIQSAVIWCREFNVTFGYATL